MNRAASDPRPRSRHAAPRPSDAPGYQPVSRLPRPVGAGRTPRRDALTVALSGTALLVLLAGVPAALVVLVGNPLPTEIPDRSWLTAPVSATFLIDLLAVVLWGAWVHFGVCVGAELRAAWQHRLPNRVPCGGGSQLLARRLVAGLLVLSGAFGLGQPLPEAEARAHEVSAVLLLPADGRTTASTTAATAVEGSPETGSPTTEQTPPQKTGPTLWYEVVPPDGRRHDCLWDIAERTLGDPRRYKEIFSLNRDRVQADGRRLVDADLIRPGWQLLMPSDARGPGITAVSPVRVPGASGKPSGNRTGTTRTTTAHPGTGDAVQETGGLGTAGTTSSGRHAAADRAQDPRAGATAGLPSAPDSTGTTGDRETGGGTATGFRVPPAEASRNPDGSLVGLSGNALWPASTFARTPPPATPPTAPSRSATASHAAPSPTGSVPSTDVSSRPTEAPTAGGTGPAAVPPRPGPRAHATASVQQEPETVSPTGRPAVGDGSPRPDTRGTSGTSATGAGSPPVPERFAEPGVMARRPPTDFAVIGGGLLLAGVLVALATRRGPYADPDEEETPLRVAADPELSSLIDRGLRRLAAGRAEQELPLPEITAAVAGDGELVLHLAPAPGESPGMPPAPWTATEDANTWTVREEDLPPDRDDTAAPYPALVNLLSLRGFEVLIDLEAAPGLVSVCGNLDMARQVVTSLAAELATNEWSDGIVVTMVGFGDDLVGLAPGSLRHANRLSEVLGDVDERLDRHASLLSSLGVDGVLAGRTVPGARRWPPQILVLSGPPTPHESARLHGLLSRGRTPLGAICVGDSPGARWRIVLDESGSAELAALGLRGKARRLPQEEYRRVLELFRNADLARQEQSARVAALTPAAVLDERAVVAEEDRPGPGGEPCTSSRTTGSDHRSGPILLGSHEAPEPGPITGTLPGTARLGHRETPRARACLHGEPSGAGDPCSGAERAGNRIDTDPRSRCPDRSAGHGLDPVPPVTVNIQLLGPVGVEADATATAAPADRELRLLTELVIAVCLHPDGIADQNLRSALWPRGACEEVQRAAIARAREWMGRDDTGQDRLHQDDRGRWRLTSDVRSDWEAFRTICVLGQGDLEIDALRAALDLGHGEVFVPPSPGGYTWLAFARAARDARLLITTVARRAACLERARGRTLQARRVLEQGIVMVPLAEPLWRELIRLSASDGPPAVAAIADRMHSTLAGRGIDRPEPETLELLGRTAPGHVHRTA